MAVLPETAFEHDDRSLDNVGGLGRNAFASSFLDDRRRRELLGQRLTHRDQTR